ncbi:MAG: hypothetical protein Ct9H300mP5_5500 [Candidatus Pelagibacterales bacterium]|nr:MAG: hypothetical protein Ct9H300mP5_5500 [Pelagibacterales bacterium]
MNVGKKFFNSPKIKKKNYTKKMEFKKKIFIEVIFQMVNGKKVWVLGILKLNQKNIFFLKKKITKNLNKSFKKNQ